MAKKKAVKKKSTKAVSAKTLSLKERYMKAFEAELEGMLATTKSKNADYTGLATSPFFNFEHVAHFGVASVEQGLFTRMTDKVSRIASYIQKGVLEVKTESAEDTLTDLAVYSIMTKLYLKHKRGDL